MIFCAKETWKLEFFLTLSFSVNKDDAVEFVLSDSGEIVFPLALNSSLKTFKTSVTSQHSKPLVKFAASD